MPCSLGSVRIALVDRRFRLLAHPPFERGFAALLQPRRVDDGEGKIGEFGRALAAVARYARSVVDQGQLFADEPVEQRRFADIGTADYRERK